MLSRGPITLAPLVPYLEDLLDDPSWRFRIRIDDAVLSWEGWRKKLDLRVRGARFVDREGAELISVPSLSITFDGRALLAGQVRVTGLELIEPRLRLLRHHDGSIEITNRDAEENSAGQGIIFDPGALAGAEQDANVAVFGDLRRLSVRRAELSFHDAASGLDLSVPSADFSLRQESDGVALRLSTRLRIGQSEAALGISALYRDEASPIAMAVNFAEVDIAGLAEAIGGARLRQVRGLQVVAAGRMDLSLLTGGEVESLEFDLTTGPGRILLPGLQSKAMPIAAAAAKGRFVNNMTHLKLADLRLDLGQGLLVRASGEWRRDGEGMWLRAKGQFSNLPAAKLSLYWPDSLGVAARTWVLANVHRGVAPQGSFSVDLRPGDLRRLEQGAMPRPGMLRLDWSFRDVEADYFGALPPLREARGSGYVDGREFGLTLDGAVAGGLQVKEGRLHVPDTLAETPILDVEFVAHGGIGQALALLDAKPLGFARALGIRPEDAAGASASRVRFRIPLRDDLTLAQIGYSAAANLTDLALLGLAGGYALNNGAFALTLEQEGLRISGRGEVNGVPLQLTWKRAFQPAPNAPGDRLTVRGNIADGQWQALGLPAMARLRGPVNMALSIDAYDGGARRGAARIDLTTAAVDLTEIGWHKPAAVPAELKLTFQMEANGAVLIDHWDISGGGLAARGSARIDPKAGLVSLGSDEFVLGATQLAVRMQAMPGGGYRLDLKGPSLDLRPFVAGWRADATVGREPPLDLNLDIQRVLLTDDIAVGQLLGTGRRRAGNWLSASMRGRMAGGQSVGFTVRAEARGRRFIVVAGDAGGMARVLGLYDNARGGTMRLNFLVPDRGGPDAAIVGQLRADNFHIVKAPVLTRLLTLGSLQGLGDLLNDKGIAFTRLDVPFVMRGDRLRIERARAVGPALALTATGDYERAGRGLRFHGAIVPSYTINSVLGAIPILGELLIGRKGEGVFAFTYKVRGSLDKPRVTVNLLSALAPGFLRRIVEGLENPALDETAVAPDTENR